MLHFKLETAMLNVFISYAREDIFELKQVIASVQNIIAAREANFWYDDNIPGGTEFERILNENIYRAHLYIPLLSDKFMASEWCCVKELHLAYEQTKRGHCRIMPIVLRSCDWKNIALEPLHSVKSVGAVKRLGELHTHMNPDRRLDTSIQPSVFYYESHNAIRRMLNEIQSTNRELINETPVAPKRQSISLSIGSGVHTWCEFIEVTSPSGSIWVGSRPLPLMRQADQVLRCDHPLIRLNQKQIPDLVGELCVRNDAVFRVPTSAEWRYSMTVNGTSKRIPRRPPRPELEPRWGDYTANEIGIFAPCLGAEEWAMDKYDLPETIATLHRGSNGPEAKFRYDTGAYPGMRPAIRIICESFPPSLSA